MDIHDKLEAIEDQGEFYGHAAERARASMADAEVQEVRWRSPVTMGEIDWLQNIVSEVPDAYRHDRSCAVHEAVYDVVCLIIERVLLREKRRAPAAGSLTFERVKVACANIGHDLNCGACAALFFTGFGGYEHSASCSKAIPSETSKAIPSETSKAIPSEAETPKDDRCPGCRSRLDGTCPGCATRRTSSKSKTRNTFVEPKIIWRGSVGDFATDVMREMGPMVASAIAEELAKRSGVEVIARDREAAIGWAYGKPSAEMDDAGKAYVKSGARAAGLPSFLDRLSRSFAEVRSEKEKP